MVSRKVGSVPLGPAKIIQLTTFSVLSFFLFFFVLIFKYFAARSQILIESLGVSASLMVFHSPTLAL